MAGEGVDAPRTFPCHRSVAPMLRVMLALSMIELIVVHGLVALAAPGLAIILSGVSLGAVVWFGWAIRSLRTRPSGVVGDVLTMRAGVFRTVAIPIVAIAGLRADWSAGTLKARGMLNLALLAYPNIVIDLAVPVEGPRGRAVDAVAHKLDDPDAFRAWIALLPQARGLR